MTSRTDRPGPSLNPKQQRFVGEYLVDLSASKAAIRAGYSAKTAYQIGWVLLRKPHVAAAVRAGLEQLSKRADAAAARAVEQLETEALIAVTDVLDFSGKAPRLRPRAEILKRVRSAITSVRTKRAREHRMLALLDGNDGAGCSEGAA